LLTKKLLEEAGHTGEIFGMNHPANLFSNKYFTDFVDYSQLNFWQKIKFGLRAIYNTQAKENLAALLDDFRPDVVHFHNIYHQLSCSVIDVAKEYGFKTVMTLHDYKFISPNYNLFHHGRIDESCVGGKYYRCLWNNCMENLMESLLSVVEAYFVDAKDYKAMINKYISPSEFLKNKFVKAGFQTNKIIKLSNPILDTEFIDNNLDQDFVLYVGRLSAEKGVKYLVQAAAILSDIKFKIIGEGNERVELEQIVETQKLTNIDFLGVKDHGEVDDMMNKARLVVVPSVWYENSPMTVLEAKARAKVVVASDIGGLSEILSAELLVGPADAKALADKIKEWFDADNKKLQATGRQLQVQARAENSSGVYLKKLLEIYHS
ncbi:MAG: hypothetical protein ACD_72C00424G0001, partial [uncultured bacterium]